MNNVIDLIVPVIIFVAVIAGIVTSIKESMTKNQKAQSQQTPQPSRAQQEVAAFLAQNNSVSAAQQQRPQPQRPVQQQKPQRAAKADAVKDKKKKRLSSGVSEHVDSFIGDHVRSHINRDVDSFVKKDIDERVKSHLGSQSSQPVEMSNSDTGSNAADDLLATLKTPGGVRQAIIMNEILSRPRSMRK